MKKCTSTASPSILSTPANRKALTTLTVCAYVFCSPKGMKKSSIKTKTKGDTQTLMVSVNKM